MKTETCSTGADEMFFAQLEDFCRMVQQEFVARFNEVSEIPGSNARALSFAETLILCPTREAAQTWIHRELPAALSFVLAIQGMQRQLQIGALKLPTEVPRFQTKFYLLAVTVREYLESLQLETA
ncbi:MAG TPA: hypothetical protein VFE51_27465 [Verrucomicrobiae bacterium]|nr:hypothetical protein [Verrucomicrobiae bacterium]